MTATELLNRLLERGVGRPVGAGPGVIRACVAGSIEIAVAERDSDTFMRARWRQRVGTSGRPYLLLADERPGRVRVLGPSSPEAPIRSVDFGLLADAIAAIVALPALDAVRRLAEDLARIAGDGLTFNGILTRHTLEHRFQSDGVRWEAAKDIIAEIAHSDAWRPLLTKIGYTLEQLPVRGHLARHEGRPVAVVHPKSKARDFARLDSDGRPPEGVLLQDCHAQGASYGILTHGGRFRLFDAKSASPASEWLEFDARLLGADWLPFLALLAPSYLADGGFERLRTEARTFGVGLSKRLDRTIRQEALPALAAGMERWAHRQGIDLTDDDARRELERAALTLIFRLIFVLFGESAGHLPMRNRAYGRVSLSSLVQEAHDTMSRLSPTSSALWGGFERLVTALRVGNPAWDMPAYNGALFAATDFDGAELLDQMELADPDFARVLVAIGRDEEASRGADFSTLQIAHVGHTYESLLGLRLSLARRPLKYDARGDRYEPVQAEEEPEIASGGLLWQTHAGGRKAGGVYYTPVDIVRHLVNGAVLPAYERHLEAVAHTAKADPAEAARELLSFAVVDPACGSAHFLVQVAETLAERTVRFLAEHPLPDLARAVDSLRDGATPGAEIDDVALLRRLIVKQCVFGVDRSPMGAEVATLSLWLASFVPGMSLAYLNRNIVVGDSLIGVGDPAEVLEDGGFFAEAVREALEEATEAVARLTGIHDRTPEEVAESQAADEEATAATAGLRRLFDLWTAEQFGLTNARQHVELYGAAVIDGDGSGAASPLVSEARTLAETHRCLHWPLAFPQVFSRDRPGFDVVVGNPPWEEITIEELSFYGMFLPGVNSLPADQRSTAVARLVRERPELPGRLQVRRERLEAQRQALAAGNYQPMGGDPDLYKYFCQRYDMLVRKGGFTGIVLPRTAFNTNGSRGFRDWLYTGSTTHRVDFLLNKGRWIFDSEPRYSIGLVVAERALPDPGHQVRVAGTAETPREWAAQSSREGIRLPASAFGPGWETPLVRSQGEADLLARLRTGHRFPRGAGRWSCFPVRELDETNDKKFWRGKAEGQPLWKGASFDQYDPKGTDERHCPVTPAVLKKIRKPRPGMKSLLASTVPVADRRTAVCTELDRARVAFRDVARATDSHTIRACLIPPEILLTNKAPYLTFVHGEPVHQAACLAVMNSLPFDWQARRFIEISANFFLLEGFHLPDLDDGDFQAIAEAAARLSAVDERFADFAASTGVEVGELTRAERTRLRVEIDARVARAWNLTADDLGLMFQDFSENAVTPAYRSELIVRVGATTNKVEV